MVYTNICRVCLSSNVTLFSIFETDGIVIKIKECASVEINIGDALPSTICSTCLTKVNDLYDFRTLIRHSDNVLKNQLLSNKFELKTDKNEDIKKEDSYSDYNIASFCSPYIQNAESESEFSKPVEGLVSDISDDYDRSKKRTYKTRICKKSGKTTKIKNIKPKRKRVVKRRQRNKKSDQILHSVVKNDKYIEIKDNEQTSDDIDQSGDENKSQNVQHKRTKKTLPKGSRTHNKGLKCEECGEVFASMSALKCHGRIHGKGSYLCATCGRSFPYPSELRIHQRVHENKKSFICEQCGKGFNHKSNLTAHRKIHTGLRPHICHICNKGFTQYPDLKRHIKRHLEIKNYKCTYCDKAFVTKPMLTKHIRSHTGEKPYGCEYCGRRFADKWNQTQHVRLHTDEKPYSCRHCPMSFATTLKLKIHVTKTHPDTISEENKVKGHKSTSISVVNSEMENNTKPFCKSEYDSVQPVL